MDDTIPAGLFVRPLKEDNSVVAFQFPFQLAGKSLDDGARASVVTEQDNGDLLIDGMAAVFDGLDRQSEQFAPGSLAAGIKAFLAGGAPLCFHHKHDQVLGRVLEMEEVEGKGIRALARVDGAIKNHPVLGTIYEQIKNGSIASYSLGGFFKRAMTPNGPRIVHVDPTELSATAVPVMANGTQFSVIAGKALENFNTDPIPDELSEGVLVQLSSVLDGLEAALEGKAVKPPKGSHHDRRRCDELAHREEVLYLGFQP